MATLNMNNGRQRKGKPSKLDLRVDFTPMVDMNMLLITFFMFCTTLAKPQIMDIVMPAKTTDDNGTETGASRTTTLILGENDKIYYYLGKPNFEDPASLKVTDYSADGLRSVLLDKNALAVQQIKELKKKKMDKSISDEAFTTQMVELKKKGKETVIIKPTDDASYQNLVNTLDEMQMCNITKYAIVDVDAGDNVLLANYKSKK